MFNPCRFCGEFPAFDDFNEYGESWQIALRCRKCNNEVGPERISANKDKSAARDRLETEWNADNPLDKKAGEDK